MSDAVPGPYVPYQAYKARNSWLLATAAAAD
jgi:hypothetical protein